MPFEHYKTQVLLLHSEQTTLNNLSTGFNDRYSVHLATSGTEALNIFTETPVHVIVSAQDLPGMSGLDALREAKKRSPDTIGILLAGTNKDDGLEALVGERDIFQIVRGPISPDALRTLVDAATKQARLVALSTSANDTTANLDMPVSETIVMETAENGIAIVSDGTGQMRALRPHKIAVAADSGSQHIDVLVLTKDEEFLATIKDSSRGLHNVHHAVTPTQAMQAVKNHKIGVLVTDAAMVGSNIEVLTQRLRQNEPRLVAVVAGRRDDGELLMDLINRGHVYRFLLKPVSPGRARLAIEASINHHLRAPEKAFKAAARAATGQQSKAAAKTTPAVKPEIETKSPAPMKALRADTLTADRLDDAFADDNSFAATITDVAVTIRDKLSGNSKVISPRDQSVPAAAQSPQRTMKSFRSAAGNPKFLGLAAGMIVIVAGIAWFALSQDDESPLEIAAEGAAVAVNDASVITPTVVESDILLKQTPATVESATANDLLSRARAASAAGQLVTPPGENAIELYMSLLQASADDPDATRELAAVVDQVFGLAESAILGQRLEDATTALQMLQLASPGNPRLPFLSAQLSQLQLRNSLNNARIAIREGRFEDAGGWIAKAGNLAGAESTEVNDVAYELSTARNQQQVDEVLALANSRVEQNQLIRPANDNARYYYELALSNDPDSTAARQGLGIVASKLVLQARILIVDGQLADADVLLRNARALDPSGKQLAAATTALENATKAEAEARAVAKTEAEAEVEARAIAKAEAEAEVEARAIAKAEAEAEVEARAVAKAEAEAEVEARAVAKAEAEAEVEVEVEVERLAAQHQHEQQQLADELRSREQQAALAAAAATVTNATAAADITDTGSVPTINAAIADNNPGTAPLQDKPAANGVPGPLQQQSNNGAQVEATASASVIISPATGADAAEPESAAGANSNDSVSATPAAPPPDTTAEPESVALSSLTRIKYVAPKYPRSARRRGVTGSVDVSFTVQKNGAVTDIAVLASRPGNIFDDAAIEAIAQWRFEPAIENTRPVSKQTAVRLTFDLQ